MISIIICHHQGDLILKAIESVRKSINVQYEIIVVTSEKRIFAHAKTVHLEGEPAIKRNLGVRYAGGDYIAFFDDDVEVDKWCLSEMFKVLKRPGVGMVYGKLLNMEHRSMFDEAGSFMTWTGFLYARGDRIIDEGQFEKVEPILGGKSASCMIKRGVFEAIRGFDETMGILGEETDLSWRVISQGFKVLYAPKSVAYHAFNTKFKPKTFYTDKRVFYNGCRNYITMLLKNMPLKYLWYTLPIQVGCWVLSGVGKILTFRFSHGINIFKGLWYVVRNLKRILKLRHPSEPVFLNPPISYFLKRYLRYITSSIHG